MNYDNILKIVKEKADNLMELINPESPLHEAPCTIDGKYTGREFLIYEPSNWTHSFFTGIVAYMYYHFKEEKYLDYLKKQKGIYTTLLFDNEKEISHDVGFMYSLYAVAMYKFTGDGDYKQLALKAADEIGKRYQFKPNVVQAFYDMRIRGITDDIALIIVDDMMNMQLLMWAYNETGHSFYRSVYTNHIENSIKNLIRDDYSVRHAFHFDARTGAPLTEMNYCGYSIGTHWARGTAWMIYGLTSALKHTGCSERYLLPLMGVNEKFVSLLNDDYMPVWDFKLPENEPHTLDTSAAAIAASAYAEFDGLNIKDKEKYLKLSDKILDSLCTNYMADKDSQNIITKGQSGNLETGTIWGDYFFVELLMKKLHGKDTPSFWL
ncbi:MAG: glycoside hydrolase family 88 protein [Clostridia bacterium]|nr:glycoside hydrolase family 88 protein [Clostridia bacterium]